MKLTEVFKIDEEDGKNPFDLWWDTYIDNHWSGAQHIEPFKDQMRQVVDDALFSGLEGDKLRFEILHGWHELLGGHANGVKGLSYIMNAIEGKPLPDLRASRQGGIFFK